VYTFGRQRNATVKRIILDDTLGRKILIEIFAYFLILIQEIGKLVSFGRMVKPGVIHPLGFDIPSHFCTLL